MSEEITVQSSERLPSKNRLGVQAVLMQMMLGENPDNQIQINWADKYAKKVSDIIDDTRPDNTYLRDLVKKGDPESYLEASKMLLKMLTSEEMEMAA